MHKTAMDTGAMFFQHYFRESFRTILDIGSYDVNGTLRSVAPPDAEYIGIDSAVGPGVDLVPNDPYRYPYIGESFDCVVSTSCFEHDHMFWLTFSEACRMVTPAGFIYINAPSAGVYHGLPNDFWRFYPDAGIALESWGRRVGYRVRLVESFQFDGSEGHFRDFIMIFTKDMAFEPEIYLRDRVQAVYPTVNARRGSGGALIDPKPEIS